MHTVIASTRRLLRPHSWLGMVLVLLIAVVGCGGKKSASVKGTVKTNGQAVTGGTLVFSPVGTGEVGKPATATIGADGTYTLGTDRPGDGAVVGKHRVTFSPPEPQVTEEQRTNQFDVAPAALPRVVAETRRGRGESRQQHHRSRTGAGRPMIWLGWPDRVSRVS
ncbi:MAG: hypothetical protein U0736_06660 [Gemmataceae bacterium]